MARQEAPREDIMREAVALRRRVAFQVTGSAEPVVCGVRNDGRWSFFLDPDRVYQFDAEARIRRAFVGGILYRTQGTTLARMRRERTAAETLLVRDDLSCEEFQAFGEELQQLLGQFLQQLEFGQAILIERIPPEEDLLPDLKSVLKRIISGSIQPAPALRTKPE